ncbi:PTS system lactose-specific IIB component, Lac family /PTS system lactose-specific IIC component, Lac family [Selenomonas ruminantium]|uniref:PTS system lactose-specific EIICB component n=1 Tax=Selenomonas ruminantium TaxID=971 RepID=A0A1M6TAZ9_SELRU|nr:PTS lactose transporter subunit IIBC [Selenomonas ruminantium]SHK54049.1 PTS system lactose-specific IIB component, Lac family /PTS system lactose-specific IIC component, Lac family [Selenomonas ruminantium]
MEKLIKMVETMKPFFEKVSNNIYLRAIRDGFVSCIPVILFSSLFILVACVPEIFDYKWPEKISAVLWQAYNYSMGMLGILMVATIAKSLTDSLNTKMPKLRQINDVSVMIVSIICLLLLAVAPVEGGISTEFMGTKGLLSAFVVAFTVPNIYKFFVKRNITIKLPDEVPHYIAQTFADLIPLSVAVMIYWVFGIVFKEATGMMFGAWILEVFKPLFVAADGYIGLAIIYGAMAMFWFVGIHGPSIVEPAVTAIYIANIEANLQIVSAGGHATNILTHPTSYFVATLGGTGATLMFCAMCAFIAKSKQLRAVGRASIVPVTFAVNEPIIFGAPIVLNPVLFFPFVLTPILNVWVFKFFVDNLGMNAFTYILPWTTPAPIGLIIGTGFAQLAFVLAPLLLVMDAVMYYPFFRVYDAQLVEKEKAGVTEEAQAEAPAEEAVPVVAAEELPSEDKRVLVLCASGATSSMLAKAITKGAEHRHAPVESIAMAYGQHKDIITDFDLIVLAPQMASMYDELKSDCEAKGVKSATTSGREYVGLTRDPDKALDFALALMAH